MLLLSFLYDSRRKGTLVLLNLLYSLHCLLTSFLACLLNRIGWLGDLISTFLMGTYSSIAFRNDEENLCHMDSTLFMVDSSISVLFICVSKVLTSHLPLYEFKFFVLCKLCDVLFGTTDNLAKIVK